MGIFDPNIFDSNIFDTGAAAPAADSATGGDDAPGSTYVSKRVQAEERKFQERRKKRARDIERTIRKVVDPESILEAALEEAPKDAETRRQIAAVIASFTDIGNEQLRLRLMEQAATIAVKKRMIELDDEEALLLI